MNGMKIGSTPQLVYSEVSYIDLTEISDYVSKLTTAGAITPDEEMEEFLRGLAGLPMRDKKDTDLNYDEDEKEEPEADRGKEDDALDTKEPTKTETK